MSDLGQRDAGGARLARPLHVRAYAPARHWLGGELVEAYGVFGRGKRLPPAVMKQTERSDARVFGPVPQILKMSAVPVCRWSLPIRAV